MTAIAGSIAVEVVADLGQLESGLKRADATAARAGQSMAYSLSRVERVAANTNTATGRLAQSYIAMGAAAGTATTATGRLAAANENAAQSMGVLTAAARTLAGALALIGSAQLIALGASIAKVGMEMQALERGFAASAGSAQQGAREMNFVRDQADRLGLALGETAKQYMQMVAASQGTALQGQGTRDAFLGVVTAMTALGKGSEETGRALTAVQQMMSKGKVASEELKGQLGEVLPGAFNLAAQAMGKTTTEFSKMLDDGDVLASDLLPKLAAKLKEMYGAAASQGGEGLAANLNRLRTAWTDYANEVANGGLNEALNRATQSLTRFVQAADGAAAGRQLGAAIDEIVQALDRVPRGFENLGIGIAILRDLAREFAAWWSTLAPVSDAMTNVGEVSIEAAAAASEGWRNGINTVVGVAVAGGEMIGAAFGALPSVMGEIAVNAANALIRGIEAGVNAAIDLINKLIAQVNGVLAMIPGNVASAISAIAPVAFTPLENASAGASEKILGDLKAIGDKASNTDYLGAVGEAGKGALDNLRGRFKAYRDDMDAASREQTKFNSILKKTQDQQAQAGTSAKKLAEATKDGAGGAKDAASAYDNLIQRTKDRIQELELEAQYASKTATEVIKLKLAHDLERAAKKEGKTVTQEMRDDWDRLGSSLATATQNLEAARLAQRRMNEALRETGNQLTDIAEDLLTGDFASAMKNLGRDSLRNSLSALFTGTGPLAALTGLAPTEKGGVGGIFGDSFFKQMSKAVSTGTEGGWTSLFGSPQQGPLPNGKTLDTLTGSIGNLAGVMQGIGAIGGAYGIGAGAGSMAQAGIGGALSGGMAGLALAGSGLIGGALGSAAVLGPLGLIAGAGLAIYGQQQAREQQKKERRRQALEAYREAQPQIAQFGAQLRGDPQGTIAQRFEEARASTQKLGDIAVVAGKRDEAIKLFEDLDTYRYRVMDEFRASFAGMLDAFSDGTGPNSPFAAARDSVKSLGDQLEVFVDDTKTVYGAGAPEIERAREAVRAHALSVLDGAREMSVVATRLEEIRGAGAGLQQVLTDLGMSAGEAARAIQERTVAALARLKTSFEDDLGRRTNSALDKGYLNEAADLIKELATLRADAAALGTDQGLVTDYFKAQAQSIVDGAELTGEAFADLIRRFPALNGYVREFSEKIDAATKAAEIAARRLGYQDRLFAASNDTTTLAGQLAAFDRQAMREREAEIKAGGDAILDLEAAQAAERFNIIREFNQRAVDDQKRAAEEARSFWERFAKQISDYVADQRGGSQSPLSPQDRLAAAQARFAAQLALAQGGDRDALSGITGERDRLVDAARDFYASSTQFQQIWSTTLSQIEALPDLVSDTQLIIDAIDAGAQATVDELAVMRSSLLVAVNSGSAQQIAAALSSYFNKIDTNTSASIDFAEMQAALRGMASESQLRDMFTRLDTDNSGGLTQLELIETATKQGTTATNNVKAATDLVNTAVGLVRDAANSTRSSVDALWSLNSTTATSSFNSWQRLTMIYDAVERSRYNLQSQNLNWPIPKDSAITQISSYATGGLVNGPGTGTSDSINARLSNGEYVLRAAAVDRFGVGLLDQMNDNFRMPAVPVPVAYARGSGQSSAELLAELKALRAELAELRKDTRAGAALVGEAVVDVGAAVQTGNRLAEDNNKRLRRDKAA